MVRDRRRSVASIKCTRFVFNKLVSTTNNNINDFLLLHRALAVFSFQLACDTRATGRLALEQILAVFVHLELGDLNLQS